MQIVAMPCTYGLKRHVLDGSISISCILFSLRARGVPALIQEAAGRGGYYSILKMFGSQGQLEGSGIYSYRDVARCSWEDEQS